MIAYRENNPHMFKRSETFNIKDLKEDDEPDLASTNLKVNSNFVSSNSSTHRQFEPKQTKKELKGMRYSAHAHSKNTQKLKAYMEKLEAGRTSPMNWNAQSFLP